MSRAWVWSMFLVGCTVRANPSYCDENADCNTGTTCDVMTHACVAAIDAAVADQLLVDAPRLVTNVRELRDPTVPHDTFVELSAVVVTIVELPLNGRIWVQDLGGGIGTGVLVTGVVTSVAETLAIGDVIVVANARKAMTPNDPMMNHDVSIRQRAGQILEVTKVGNTATPSISTLDVAALMLLDPTQRDAELARWSGTLAEVQNVTASSAPDDYGFSIGPVRVLGSLASIPNGFPSGIVAGTCLTSITGVVRFSSGSYYLSPRSTAEVVLGPGCP